MKEKTQKLITWLCLGIAILGSIFAIIFAMDTEKFAGMFNIAYIILFVFVGIALLAMLGYRVLSLCKGGSRGLLIGLGCLIVVAVVAFLLSSGNDISEVVMEKNSITEGTSKIIGAGCYMVYILLAVTIIAMLYVEVSKLIKKK
ncbi:MAG: hypothetical protein HUK17_01990 [Bacteroidales bacterium]|nr:hypothetical protein [Bacteroidales bacterium]